MKIYIIGIGMGNTKTLTSEAKDKIEQSDILIGAGRMLEPFSELKKETLVSYNSKEIADFIKSSNAEKISVLMSGDAGFYSGARKLLSLLDGLNAEIISGISSLVYFCNHLGISYENVNAVSMHGRKCNIVSEVRTHERTFVLLGDNPCRKLVDFNLGDTKIYIGERLSYEDEKIIIGTACDFAGVELNPLSVMLIENPNYQNCAKIGIDDDEFIRSDVPMTKSEVRSVSISKLRIEEDDICWDIGGGTGSVTVEMALLCRRGAVYSVEKNNNAAELIRRNCKKFMVDNVHIIEGSAPECLDNAEAPDKVFIGGSSGNMRGIIEAAAAKNKNVLFVINVIALESLSETIDILKEMKLDFDVSQINVSRNKKVGTLNLMTGLNPVFVISAKLK